MSTNEKYTIVDNYTSEELEKIGFTSQEIKSRKKISIYDEILIDLWQILQLCYRNITIILNYYYKTKKVLTILKKW